MAIIEVNHVSKEYRLGQLQTFKQGLQNGLARLRGLPPVERKLFKALDDVDFQITEGEVVGIIGTNGAGKSTLLKILSGITKPTQGQVRVHGKVAPLIEVGAGLNPELTGRENVFLNGAILGIPRRDIQRKLDEIVQFAELEQFIDTPVKRYSSGMKVRLGFSIATSMDAEILIVDEVLAVGDLAFQRKCFDRMEDLIKRQGKTVLLVSHNIRQVERMCTRVILLDYGKISADGQSSEVCELFFKRSNEKVQDYLTNQQDGKAKIQSSGEVNLLGIDILDEDGLPISEIESGGRLRVRIRFELKQALEKPEIVVGTHRTDFVYLTAGSTAQLKDRPSYTAGIHEIEYVVPTFPLVTGTYCIRFAMFDQHRRQLFSGETLKIFSVALNDTELNQAGLRTLNIEPKWKLQGCSDPTINLVANTRMDSVSAI